MMPTLQLIIPSVVGLLAVVVAVVAYVRQKQTKALSYDVISRSPLVAARPPVEDKVKIFVEGEPVRDLRFVEVRMTNSGNVPLKREDYDSPLRLSFGTDAQVFSPEISDASPAILRSAGCLVEGNAVVIEKVLLNAGDSVTIKALVAQLGEVSVEGRIVGVNAFQTPKRRDRRGIEPIRVASRTIVVFGLIFFIGMASADWSWLTSILVLTAVSVLIGLGRLWPPWDLSGEIRCPQ